MSIHKFDRKLASPVLVGGWDTLAWALHPNGRHAEAHVAVDQVLATGTNTAVVRCHAGAIAAARGATESAVDQLEAALDIDDGFADDARNLLTSLTSLTSLTWWSG